MYESQVRPGASGRKLVAHQSKQHHPSSGFYTRATDTVVPFLQSSYSFLLQGRLAGLFLLTCCIGVITGCGGLSYNSSHVALSEISCGTQSLTGAQSKSCSLSLTAAALAPITIQLSSSNPALKVPSGVQIAAGQSSATFNAVTTKVSKATTVTITAHANGVTRTNAVTLYPAPAATLTSVSCTAQSLTGPSTTACSVQLSSADASPIAIKLSTSSSALQVPAAVTVNAGATSATFNASASAVSSTQNVTLTAAAGSVSQSLVINVLGSGTQTSGQHRVQLSWNAPDTSVAAILGYNVYRATAGLSNYALLNTSLDQQTTFADTGVVSGSTYEYVVKSVDSNGMESSPSNSTQVTIP